MSMYHRCRAEETEIKRNRDLCLQTCMLMVSQETYSGLRYQVVKVIFNILNYPAPILIRV